MNKWIFSMVILVSFSQAQATSGVDCQSVDGFFQVSTQEAIDSSQNTVLSMNVIAPWIQEDPIIFSRSGNQLTFSNSEGAVYMGANDYGQQITMTLVQDPDSQITTGSVYLKNQDAIYFESVSCY